MATIPAHPTVTLVPNADLPVGTPVLAWPGSREGRALMTRTRTPVWTLGSGEAVVSVEGCAGGIALTHIEVLPYERHRLPAHRRGDA